MSLPLVLICAAGAGVAAVALVKHSRGSMAPGDVASPLNTAASGDDIDDDGVIMGAAGGMGSVGTAPNPGQFPQDGITGSGAPAGSDAPTPDGGAPAGQPSPPPGHTQVLHPPTNTAPPPATKFRVAKVSSIAFSNDAGMTSQQKDGAYSDGTAAKLGLVW